MQLEWCNTNLKVGEVYRDVDGQLVQLLKCEEDVCCYVPVERGWNDRQYTHRDNFQRRFELLSDAA